VDCNSSCQKCSPDVDTCTECLNTEFLYEGACLSECPPSVTITGTGTCTPCDSNCKTCAGTTTTCKTCHGSFKLYENACVASCPADTTIEVGDLCQNCDSNCTTCVDSVTNCVTCATDEYLYNNTCQDDCQAGTTIKNETDKTCEACNANCVTCETTTVNCTTCATGNYLFNGTCVTPCPNGYVVSGASCTAEAVPTPCDGEGGSCSNDLINNDTCETQCNIEACIYDNGSCVIPEETCTTQQYKDSTGTCQACVYPCQTCTSSITCTSCAADTGTGSTLNLYNNECLSSCPSGTIPSTTTAPICLDCDPSCLTCSGEVTTCLSCNTGDKLFSNQCINSCPFGETIEENGAC